MIGWKWVGGNNEVDQKQHKDIIEGTQHFEIAEVTTPKPQLLINKKWEEGQGTEI